MFCAQKYTNYKAMTMSVEGSCDISHSLGFLCAPSLSANASSNHICGRCEAGGDIQTPSAASFLSYFIHTFKVVSSRASYTNFMPASPVLLLQKIAVVRSITPVPFFQMSLWISSCLETGIFPTYQTDPAGYICPVSFCAPEKSPAILRWCVSRPRRAKDSYKAYFLSNMFLAFKDLPVLL
jgi:hypothetical protein